MPVAELILANLNFTRAPDIQQGFVKFVSGRNPVLKFLVENWSKFAEWLSQPHVYAVIIAWVVTFTILVVVMLSLGFGALGIVAGSIAAAFQGWMYGGFTPAAGVFATLTSMAMLGILQPVVVLFSGLVATGVALIVWACGVGRKASL